MDLVKINIDGQDVEVPAGSTILEAARAAGIDIPTLCYHPVVGPSGACRVCIVEVQGAKSFVASCVYPVSNGMVVRTNTQAIREARRTVVELLIGSHPQDCLACERNGKCELQDLAERLGIRDVRFRQVILPKKKDESSFSVVRNPEKCILCGRCVTVCRNIQDVGAIGLAYRGKRATVTPQFDRGLAEVTCVGCGQCAAVCPVGAIYEKDETQAVWSALDDPAKHVVVQVAPAVRAALGEEFGFAPGTVVTGKMVRALRLLGFDAIFDTQFSADLTIMEEGHELLERLKAGGRLPLFTSCSPGWIKYCETFHPEFLDNISTCKSPQQMMGAVVKTYYAKVRGIAPESIYCVSVMPCTAKKSEARRPEMGRDGIPDVDAVLTTRELARMIKAAGIDFANLKDDTFDSPLGTSTGAGTLFGVTGGVMEAAIRTVYEVVTKKPLATLNFSAVRGFEGIREATVDLAGRKLRVAIAHGLGNASRLLDSIAAGEGDYDFVEFMACPGGCICGGGQPRSCDPEIAIKRAAALYAEDERMALRKSHENWAVRKLYEDYLGRPGSERAHELLHTTYGGRAASHAGRATLVSGAAG